ncbi:Hint domain-containing protein [Rhodobacteraceae bacterium CCMM004]|nr:Hint domain-containing protein [Rhodobacteraceae bacterium CCMM004]
MLRVYPAAAFACVDGANLGDPMDVADALIPGDVYALQPGAAANRIEALAGAPMTVAARSAAGRPGAPLYLDACATFMCPDGAVVEMLLLAELADDGSSLAALHLMPLAPLQPKRGYALIAIDRDVAAARLAETDCVAFTRGTRITLATGLQIPVEDLRPGDRVLTRDNGVQPLRWVGQRTVRAQGAFAPIRIAAGALMNDGDLVVAPNHRLFVYQRTDALGAGQAEVLVKARHLIDDDDVTVTQGGFVDYFHLLFDGHEIIYAEGIAAESLTVDTRTRPALPRDIVADTRHVPGPAIEIGRAGLPADGALATLRAASLG